VGTFFCCVTATYLKTQRNDNGVVTNSFNVQSWPFGVAANNYHEAVGMANAVLAKIRKRFPVFETWAAVVNQSAGKGLITDPKGAEFVDAIEV
jgi:nitroreductase